MFFDLWYCRTPTDDEDISFMVFHRDSGDVLYADLNNDEDLTNDGEPLFFPYAQKFLSIDLHAKGDSMQITTLRVRRRPDVPDSLMGTNVTPSGDIPQRVVRIYNAMSRLGIGLGGKRGTFYFDERLTFRRGFFMFEGKNIRLGISDISSNGLYNDDQDLLQIDVNDDGEYDDMGGLEVFKLNDVFPLGGKRFEVASIDKYGRWVDIRETQKEETQYLRKEKEIKESKSKNLPPPGEEKTFNDDSVWRLRLKTIDGTLLTFADLKGRYVLLNFWGEWCGPCIAELPALVEQYNNSSREKIEFISFLKTFDLAKARGIIQKQNIRWQQILVDAKVEERFEVALYPTNILIFPDGKTYVRITGGLNKAFFEKNIHYSR